jgi:hypothetical protein
LYEHKTWDLLQEQVHLVIPTIIRFEAKRTRNYLPIDLESDFNKGVLKELSATAEQIANLESMFDKIFIERIDRGEREAIAALFSGNFPNHFFCTGDKSAIQALAMLDISDMGVSLEKLLKESGLGRSLPRRYSEEFFKEHIVIGVSNRITGVGTARAISAKKPKRSRRK